MRLFLPTVVCLTTVLKGFLRQSSLVSTNVIRALDVFLNDMCCINHVLLTYLLTYLLTFSYNAVGYVAETVIRDITIPTTLQVLSVKSVGGWIIIHSRETAAYQLDMSWNDLEMTRNCIDILQNDSIQAIRYHMQ